MSDKEKHLPLFVVIPANIHFNERVSDKEVRIYGYVSALANSKGYCYATNKYLAETFKTSEKTIQRAISNLVKENLLKSVVIRDSEGMVIERRLFITLPEIDQNPYKPHNDGMDKNVHRGMDKNVQYNNINNNNIYGAEAPTEHSEANNSSKSFAESEPTTTKKKTKKSKITVVKEDSVYTRIIDHFNSKDNTKFKANNKEFVENIDNLLMAYTEDEIKGVIDYIRECNYKEEYFRPRTIFRISNFERSYEFYVKWNKKKACDTSQANSQQQQKLYYYVNVNIGQVIASPVKPNLPDDKIFSSREEAEKSIT